MTAVQVWIGDSQQLVGHLSFHQQGTRTWSSFQYDDSWLKSPQSFVVSPDLPLGRDWYTKKAQGESDSIFHLGIQDTEPDGWARRVIRRDFARQKKAGLQTKTSSLSTMLTDLDYLLGVDDMSRVGALRFCFPAGPFLRSVPAGGRGAPPFIELASIFNATQAVERNNESEADLAYLRGKGTSLGGMRPKCTILDEKNELCIGKFPSVQDERTVTKGEVLCLKLAKLAGIDAAESRLVHVIDTPVAVIKRFDRVATGGRIHYLSAASLLQVDPRQDNTYVELADAIRKFSPHARQDLHEIWRRIVFNMLVTNVDDHLHNQGFLYSGANQWRLAPAFDINPFPDRERELKTWLSEESGPTISITAAMQAISRFDLNEKQAGDILKTVVNSVQKWRTVAAGHEVQMAARQIEDFELAFENETLDEAKKILLAL